MTLFLLNLISTRRRFFFILVMFVWECKEKVPLLKALFIQRAKWQSSQFFVAELDVVTGPSVISEISEIVLSEDSRLHV